MAVESQSRFDCSCNLTPPFRPATPDDAQALADLVHFASEGLALYLWTKIAGPGGDPWAVGRERAARETGSFSYRNAVVMEREGRVAAGLIGYPLADQPGAHSRHHAGHVRAAAGAGEPGARHLVRERARRLSRAPRQGLRHRAARRRRDSWPQKPASAASASSSPIPTPARAGSTSACGYREAARRRMVKEDWQNPGTDWVLLTKARLQLQRAAWQPSAAGVVVSRHDRHPREDHRLQARGDRRRRGAAPAGGRRGRGARGPARAPVRGGARRPGSPPGSSR